MLKIPDGYDTWSEAIQAYVQARNENKTPDEVEGNVWEVFEIMAFGLIPGINK